MHFVLTEKSYDLPCSENAEKSMQALFEVQGYRVLNNTFSVLRQPRSTKYAAECELAYSLFDLGALQSLNRFCRRIFPGDGVVGIAPGHPDLLVFREDKSDVFFCEVKRGNRDVLTTGEMLGISLIHAFLDCRVEVARVGGRARTYRWIWPALQPLHPERVIQL